MAPRPPFPPGLPPLQLDPRTQSETILNLLRQQFRGVTPGQFSPMGSGGGAHPRTIQAPSSFPLGNLGNRPPISYSQAVNSGVQIASAMGGGGGGGPQMPPSPSGAAPPTPPAASGPSGIMGRLGGAKGLGGIGMRAGGGALVGGVAGNLAAGMVDNPEGSIWDEALRGAGTGAGIGATVASAIPIPGLSTAVGGVAGGLIGGLVGAFGPKGESQEPLTLRQVTSKISQLAADNDIPFEQYRPVLQHLSFAYDLAETDEEKKAVLEGTEQGPPEWETMLQNAFSQATVGQISQMPQIPPMSPTQMLEMSKEMGNQISPFAENIQQSGSTNASILRQLAGDMPTEALRSSVMQQAASREDAATQLANAYRAQAMLSPQIMAFQQQQALVNQIAQQVMSQAFAGILNPPQAPAGGSDFLNQALMTAGA